MFGKTIKKVMTAAILILATTAFAQQRGTFTDSRDGQSYRFVTIGNQTWMAQNLNFATDSGSWCYDNVVANCDTYGRLYDFHTAQTVCPAGWRLPTYEDWQTLINSVGGYSVAETKLKSKSGWSDNGNGTDDFGFSALPSGDRWNGNFGLVGYGGGWWTATEIDATIALSRRMGHIRRVRGLNWNNKANGLSVRCVRDEGEN